MPHVDVTATDITLDRVIDDLRRELGDSYKVVVPREAIHIKVETSPLVYANVHVKRHAGGARLSVHGGGFLVDRLMNEWTIARKVASALRNADARRDDGGSATGREDDD